MRERESKLKSHELNLEIESKAKTNLFHFLNKIIFTKYFKVNSKQTSNI